MKPHVERRRYVRLPVALRVDYTVKGDAPGRVRHGVTRDISLAGICLEIVEGVQTMLPLVKAKDAKLTLGIYCEQGKEPDWVGAEPRWSSMRMDKGRAQTGAHLTLLVGVEFSQVPEGLRQQLWELQLGRFTGEVDESPQPEQPQTV
jgi:c-di-GMP-binding flagellar brake protein YcgR